MTRRHLFCSCTSDSAERENLKGDGQQRRDDHGEVVGCNLDQLELCAGLFVCPEQVINECLPVAGSVESGSSLTSSSCTRTERCRSGIEPSPCGTCLRCQLVGSGRTPGSLSTHAKFQCVNCSHVDDIIDISGDNVEVFNRGPWDDVMGPQLARNDLDKALT